MNINWKPTIYHLYHLKADMQFSIEEIAENKFYWKIIKISQHYTEDLASGDNTSFNNALVNIADYFTLNNLGEPPKKEDFKIVEYQTRINKYDVSLLSAVKENKFQIIVSNGVLKKKTALETKYLFSDLEKAQVAAIEIVKMFQWMESDLV